VRGRVLNVEVLGDVVADEWWSPGWCVDICFRRRRRQRRRQFVPLVVGETRVTAATRAVAEREVVVQ
jgi:hypothetical protein